CARINALIMACLARAAARHGIEVMAYIFMGNHFHLLVRAPRCNLSEFMKDFQGCLSVRVKAFHGLGEGIFSQRFHDVALLDESCVFEELMYILANAVEAGLVDMPGEYEGLCSLGQHMSGEAVVGRWLNQDRLTRLRKRDSKADDESCAEYHELFLTPLPGMEGMSQEARAAGISRALALRCAQIVRKRGPIKKPTVLPSSLSSTSGHPSPYARPAVSKQTEYCPVALSRCVARKEEYEEHLKNTTHNYYRAKLKLYSSKKRRGKVVFPAGTTPPGLSRCVPFKKKELESSSGQPVYRLIDFTA
ncbi:MAG: transposase, partial [Bradymonadaceae bacterium]